MLVSLSLFAAVTVNKWRVSDRKKLLSLVIKGKNLAKAVTISSSLVPGNKSCSIYLVEYFISLANLPNRRTLNFLKNDHLSTQRRNRTNLKIFTLWNILPALLIFPTVAPNLRRRRRVIFSLSRTNKILDVIPCATETFLF